MTTVRQLQDFLDSFAPLSLAEEWDNVGLLVGDGAAPVRRVLTCLTVTPETVAEARAEKADAIITHHPLPFRPLDRVTRETTEGAMLLDLARDGIAVLSYHSAFDSAPRGINQRLAEKIGLDPIAPLVTKETGGGAGRLGTVPGGSTVGAVAESFKSTLNLGAVKVAADPSASASKVAIACGSAGEFLYEAITAGCDTFVTGETSFHTVLAARASGVAVILLGHYGSERFAMTELASELGEAFGELSVWASQRETDPFTYLG